MFCGGAFDLFTLGTKHTAKLKDGIGFQCYNATGASEVLINMGGSKTRKIVWKLM